MNKIISLICAVLLTAGVIAQAPNKMSYQTVIRNTNGNLVASQTVGFKISVLQGTATGTAVFVETQNATTNSNGLASFEIGNGVAQSGTFAAIDWSAGPYYIKTQADPTGGTTYTITGTSQLLSVPYALFAANAGGGSSLWTANGTNISNNNTGNVGIGTVSPSTRLEVKGLEGTMTVHPDWANTGTSVIASFSGGSSKGGQARFDGVSTLFVDCGMNDIGDFVIENGLDAAVLTATQAGFVGIGTTTPTSKLQINATGAGLRQTDGTVTAELITSGTDVYFGASTANHNMHLTAGGFDDLVIRGDNHMVGLGQNPTEKLSVAGNILVSNNTHLENANVIHGYLDDIGNESAVLSNTSIETGAILVNEDYAAIISPGDNDMLKFIDEDYLDGLGTIYDNNSLKARIDGTGGAFWSLSDANRKENITHISGALGKVAQMNGYTYKFKLNEKEIAKGQSSPVYTGVLAQELETVLPEAVSHKDGGYMVCYDQIIPMLIEAIKELKNQTDEQKALIQQLLAR